MDQRPQDSTPDNASASMPTPSVPHALNAVPVPVPVPRPQAEICPYCGAASTTLQRCSACGGRFDPLSRQVSQNHMGPWQIRQDTQPNRPGCSYATLRRLIERRVVQRDTVIRGPSTYQFWMRADRVPGVAHLLGVCHACGQKAGEDAFACDGCGSTFHIDQDRQHLGLMPTRLLPGDASPRVVAAHAAPASAPVSEPAQLMANADTPPRAPDPDISRDALQGPGSSRAVLLGPGLGDRRARALRRQNTVLFVACLALAGVLVLLMGVLWAERSGVGAVDPSEAMTDQGLEGTPMPEPVGALPQAAAEVLAVDERDGGLEGDAHASAGVSEPANLETNADGGGSEQTSRRVAQRVAELIRSGLPGGAAELEHVLNTAGWDGADIKGDDLVRSMQGMARERVQQQAFQRLP